MCLENGGLCLLGQRFQNNNTAREPKDKRRFKREMRTKDEIVKSRKVKQQRTFGQKRRELQNKSNAGRKKR